MHTPCSPRGMSVKGSLILLTHLSPVKLCYLRSSPKYGSSNKSALALLVYWRIRQVTPLVLVPYDASRKRVRKPNY
jgi:hypothetical protein